MKSTTKKIAGRPKNIRRTRINKMAVSLANNSLEEYKCDSNSSIHIKLVKTEKDVFDSEKDFYPDMSHQIFGDSEVIFGYKNLEVKLYYHAGSLLTYLGMKYDDIVDKSSSDGVEPDEVISAIGKLLSPGYLTNLDQFISKLPEENKFAPMGELLHNYTIDENTYEVYKADITTPNFRKYYEKLQTFVLWYIDAASFIDVDDDKWNFFVMFEKCKEAGSTTYNIVGYMTVYSYYAYPDMKRPRISQFLILPPFQKKGLGAKLLETVDNFFINDQKVLDMTVEDPVDDFIRLRDYVDAMACRALPAFNPENLPKGFSQEMISEAKKHRKINQHQCRRVYEILRLGVTNLNNAEEHRKYRLEIKRRLNAPFQKQKSDLEKLRKVLSSEEFATAVANMSTREHLDVLEESYQRTVDSYRRTLERMAAS